MTRRARNKRTRAAWAPGIRPVDLTHSLSLHGRLIGTGLHWIANRASTSAGLTGDHGRLGVYGQIDRYVTGSHARGSRRLDALIHAHTTSLLRCRTEYDNYTITIYTIITTLIVFFFHKYVSQILARLFWTPIEATY